MNLPPRSVLLHCTKVRPREPHDAPVRERLVLIRPLYGQLRRVDLSGCSFVTDWTLLVSSPFYFPEPLLPATLCPLCEGEGVEPRSV